MNDPTGHISALAHRLHVLEQGITQQRASERRQFDVCHKLQDDIDQTKSSITASAGQLLLTQRRACLLHAQVDPHTRRRARKQVTINHLVVLNA
jgi:hypothetical protein